MWTLDHLGQFIDAVSWEASSTQEELVELKTDLAKTVVEKMKLNSLEIFFPAFPKPVLCP